MYKSIGLFLLIFTVCLSTGCDPYWRIDHEIVNQTNRDVQVLWSWSPSDSVMTDVVAANSEITLTINDGLGYKVKDVFPDFEGDLPFQMFEVNINDTILFLRDAANIEQWESMAPRTNNEDGVFRLIISEDDF